MRRRFRTGGGRRAETVIGVVVAFGTYGYVTNWWNNHTTFTEENGWIVASILLGGCLVWAAWKTWLASALARRRALLEALEALRDATKRDPMSGVIVLLLAKAHWLVEQEHGFFIVDSFDAPRDQVIVSSRHIDYRADRDLTGVEFMILSSDRQPKGMCRLLRCNETEVILHQAAHIVPPPCKGDLATPVGPQASELERALAHFLLNYDF